MEEKKEIKTGERKHAGGHVAFLVTPEALVTQASQLSGIISDAEASIQNMEELLGKTSLYWLGEAAAAHRNAYREKKRMAEQSISGLYQHIENLLQMAGVYRDAELAADREALALPEDILR